MKTCIIKKNFFKIIPHSLIRFRAKTLLYGLGWRQSQLTHLPQPFRELGQQAHRPSPHLYSVCFALLLVFLPADDQTQAVSTIGKLPNPGNNHGRQLYSIIAQICNRSDDYNQDNQISDKPR